MSNLNKNSVLLSRIEAEKKAAIDKLASNKEKTILLLSAPEDHRNIKDSLGWTEDIIDNSNKLGEAVQELNVYEKYPDSIILSSSDLLLFCIKNGYTADKIDQYKGPTTKNLLGSIDEYCKTKEINPGELHQNHVILYPSYLIPNSTNKVIKNRQAKIADEIFIVRDVLEKQLNEHYYEIVINVGTPSYLKSKLFEFLKQCNLFDMNFEIDEKLSTSKMYALVTSTITFFITMVVTLCDGVVPGSYSDVLINPLLFLLGIGLFINFMPEVRDLSSENYTRYRTDSIFKKIHKIFFRNIYDSTYMVDDVKIRKKLTSALYKRYYIYTFFQYLLYYVLSTVILYTSIYFIAGKTYSNKIESSRTDSYIYYKTYNYEQSTFPLFKQVGPVVVTSEPR